MINMLLFLVNWNVGNVYDLKDSNYGVDVVIG